MAYWLMKSEPTTYGIDDLKAMPKGTDHWDGVRNYQARNFMRDQMKLGDLVFFYHSNCAVPGIVGVMKIAKAGYPDHTSWDPEDEHFDPKSTEENPRWFMVDVKFQKKFTEVVSLQFLRELQGLEEFPLLKKGNRLSVMPVSKSEWECIQAQV